MIINIKYDLKNKTGSAKKVIEETNYFVGLTKICANCGKAIIGHPALSRKDNKTEICSNCGTLEALEEFKKYAKVSNKKLYFEVGEVRPYVLNKNIHKGKILKVDEEDKTYLIEDIENKEQYIIHEDNVFIGDD